jgi:hypothetical protein
MKVSNSLIAPRLISIINVHFQNAILTLKDHARISICRCYSHRCFSTLPSHRHQVENSYHGTGFQAMILKKIIFIKLFIN